MTNEAMRIACAVLVGFKYNPILKKSPLGVDVPAWVTPDGNLQCFSDQLPDYVNDLNAIAEARKALLTTIALRDEYLCELENVLNFSSDCPESEYIYWMHNASAAEQLEALLRVFGRFVEDAK